MGRGLGATQRLVLDTLEAFGPFYLAALAEGDMDTRYKSLNRAAVKLFEADRIGIINYSYGHRKFVVTQPGVESRELNRNDIDAKCPRIAAWLKNLKQQ